MLTNKLFLISITILIAATHQDCESLQDPSSIRASSTIFFNNYQTQGQALIKCEGGDALMHVSRLKSVLPFKEK